MKRQLTGWALSLLVLMGLAFSIRQDLAALASRDGRQRLQDGDAPAARTAFRRAITLGGSTAPRLYNLAVSLYRDERFSEAREAFTAALVEADPQLAMAIHFNSGNCAFRQAERARDDQESARRSLRDAVTKYQEALALAPDNDDAGTNLKLAQAKLRALEGLPRERPMSATDHASPDAVKGKAAESAASGGANGAAATPRETQGDQGIATPTNEANRIGSRTTTGAARREMTRAEAESLLNEARGRERPVGVSGTDGRKRSMARSERDW